MSLAVGSPIAAREGSYLKVFSGAAIVIGILAGALFLLYPELDLRFGRLFYSPGTGFSGHANPLVPALRLLFIVFYYGCIALAIVGLVRTRSRRGAWLGLLWGQWLFLAVCLGAGPGLVGNLIFKDQWGRARPKNVAEFGGSKVFTPPLIPADQCARGCSFVSGEAASVFVPFYAASMVLPQWSVALAAAGTVGGLAAGLVRIAQGGHFLSDIIFAGVFMALTVLIVRWLMRRHLTGEPAPPS
jgi:lipid A 4'-phosphatase